VRALSPSCLRAYSNAALSKHNQLRAKHGAAPLKLDATIQRVAQAYAEHLASTNTFEHSDSSYGENLAMNGYSDIAVNDAFCSRKIKLVFRMKIF
jgi:uncharacterized protein YkwD